MTTARRAAAGLSVLVSCVLMLLVGSPVALANVGPPDTSTSSSPPPLLPAHVVNQTSGYSIGAVLLIALVGAAIGALGTVAVARLSTVHRPRMLPA